MRNWTTFSHLVSSLSIGWFWTQCHMARRIGTYPRSMFSIRWWMCSVDSKRCRCQTIQQSIDDQRCSCFHIRRFWNLILGRVSFPLSNEFLYLRWRNIQRYNRKWISSAHQYIGCYLFGWIVSHTIVQFYLLIQQQKRDPFISRLRSRQDSWSLSYQNR